MKRFISIITILLVLISIVGCSDDKEAAKKAYQISQMSNPLTFGEFAIDLPEGFYINKDPANNEIPVAYAPDYPKHTDNYTFTALSMKQEPSDYSQEKIDALYSDFLEAYSGLKAYEQTEVAGYTAIKIYYNTTIKDKNDKNISVEQHQCFIFTDNDVFVVTFTTNSKDYLEDYEKSLDTIVIQ